MLEIVAAILASNVWNIEEKIQQHNGQLAKWYFYIYIFNCIMKDLLLWS